MLQNLMVFFEQIFVIFTDPVLMLVLFAATALG